MGVWRGADLEPITVGRHLRNHEAHENHGSIRNVVWASKEDSGPLIIRHKNKNHNKLADVLSAKNFPFSEISLETVDADRVK